MTLVNLLNHGFIEGEQIYLGPTYDYIGTGFENIFTIEEAEHDVSHDFKLGENTLSTSPTNTVALTSVVNATFDGTNTIVELAGWLPDNTYNTLKGTDEIYRRADAKHALSVKTFMVYKATQNYFFAVLYGMLIYDKDINTVLAPIHSAQDINPVFENGKYYYLEYDRAKIGGEKGRITSMKPIAPDDIGKYEVLCIQVINNKNVRVLDWRERVVTDTTLGGSDFIEITNQVLDPSVNIYDLVYKDSTGIWQLALTNKYLTLKMGMVKDAAVGDAVIVTYGSIMRKEHGFQIGQVYYLSNLHAGKAIGTRPKNVRHLIQQAFEAVDENTLRIVDRLTPHGSGYKYADTSLVLKHYADNVALGNIKFEYIFSLPPVATPLKAHVSLDNVDLSSATMMYVNKYNLSMDDISSRLNLISAGDTLEIEDFAGVLAFYIYEVIGPFTLTGDIYAIPVKQIDASLVDLSDEEPILFEFKIATKGGGGKVYAQDTAPTIAKEGDTWIDTSATIYVTPSETVANMRYLRYDDKWISLQGNVRLIANSEGWPTQGRGTELVLVDTKIDDPDVADGSVEIGFVDAEDHWRKAKLWNHPWGLISSWGPWSKMGSSTYAEVLYAGTVSLKKGRRYKVSYVLMVIQWSTDGHMTDYIYKLKIGGHDIAELQPKLNDEYATANMANYGLYSATANISARVEVNVVSGGSAGYGWRYNGFRAMVEDIGPA